MLGKVYSFKQGGQKRAQRGVDVSAISEKEMREKVMKILGEENLGRGNRIVRDRGG